MPSFSRSRIAAWLQEIVSRRREEVDLYREIAAQLPLPGAGRVLDVGREQRSRTSRSSRGSP